MSQSWLSACTEDDIILYLTSKAVQITEKKCGYTQEGSLIP